MRDKLYPTMLLSTVSQEDANSLRANDIYRCNRTYQNVLCLVFELELEVAGRRQHRLDRPHAVVVVVLGGELLRAQLVCGHNLHRHLSGREETERVERYLGDHGVVRHLAAGSGQRAKRGIVRERGKDDKKERDNFKVRIIIMRHEFSMTDHRSQVLLCYAQYVSVMKHAQTAIFYDILYSIQQIQGQLSLNENIWRRRV